jgi:hypothetical protein
MAADHRSAQDIRAFLKAAIAAFGPEKAEESPVAGWTAWALGVADQIDPVGRLRSPRMERPSRNRRSPQKQGRRATGGEMPEDERLQAIKHLLFNYVRSPSLRHIRDPHALIVLANEIMRVVDGRNSVWLKWDERREKLVKSAVGCWIPFDDLRNFLNGLPGSVLNPHSELTTSGPKRPAGRLHLEYNFAVKSITYADDTQTPTSISTHLLTVPLVVPNQCFEGRP